jgi:hypothetical protein
VPVAIHRAPGPVLTFEFDGQPQLGGYSVCSTSDTPVGLKLQKSADGLVWQDVSGSRLTAPVGSGRHQRALGVGSTLAGSSRGRAGHGYQFYRLIATAESGTPKVDHVRFWLTGTRHYRNADRVVHLYSYLLSEARKARHETNEPALVDAQATADSELVGPFQVRIPLRLNATDGHAVVDAGGFVIEDVIQPETDFYLRRLPGASATTLTATTPHNLAGRVLTGVAAEGAQHRLTPVALAIPTEMAIEFDISWDANCWEMTDERC